ncbi:MAG: hypothetical protein Kow0075_02620 [Salibacteraceae bacterium]
MGFFKKHIDFVSEHAVDADMRRYVVPEEAPRHYIDIDHYGPDPFEAVPRQWNEAVEKFTEDTLLAYGIVPWHVHRVYQQLVMAYGTRDVAYILKTASDLGHYVADAHVPLHTTINYNGQLTGQHGIHGFWESRLPELFADRYDFFVGRAEYISDPLDAVWEAVERSHAAVDSVLRLERILSERDNAPAKFTYEQRGASTVRVYSREFSEVYHQMLSGMVERRMRAAIRLLGCLWYSAWVEAGQPKLDEPLSPEQLQQIAEEQKALEQMYHQKVVKTRPHEE